MKTDIWGQIKDYTHLYLTFETNKITWYLKLLNKFFVIGKKFHRLIKSQPGQKKAK